jgi:ribose transport system substrate-binding protein
MISRRALIQVGFGLAASAVAPGARAAQPPLRIGFANYNNEASFGALVLRGMQQAAKSRPDVDVIVFDNRSDANQAVENARSAVTTHVAALIEYSSISAAANPEIGRIVATAKLPTIAVQSPVPGTPLFAVDNVEAGYQTGKGIALAAEKRWPGVAPAVFLIGAPEAGPMFIQRTDAARKAILEVFPDAKPEEQSSKDDPVTARSITTAFLTQNPGKNAIIFAHEDAVGIAALTAARNAGREGDVLIGSTGGESIAFPAIRKPGSAYVGTFSFFPNLWGGDLLDLATKLAHGETLPALTRPRRQVFVDAQNIDEYFPLNANAQ